MGNRIAKHRLLALAVALGLAAATGAAGAQQVHLTRQGPWTITMSTLPGGSKAHSTNEADSRRARCCPRLITFR